MSEKTCPEGEDESVSPIGGALEELASGDDALPTETGLELGASCSLAAAAGAMNMTEAGVATLETNKASTATLTP